MSEPEPANCPRCGKAVLSGTVEEIYPMVLDPREVPHADALVLHRYGIPIAQLLIRDRGQGPQVIMSRMFWPSEEEETDWVTLLPHGCAWPGKWGK